MKKLFCYLILIAFCGCASTDSELENLKLVANEKLILLEEINADLEAKCNDLHIKYGSEEMLFFLKETKLIHQNFDNDTFLLRYNAAIDTLNKYYTYDLKHFSKIPGEDPILSKLRFMIYHNKVLNKTCLDKNFELNVYGFPRIVKNDSVSFFLSLSYEKMVDDYTKTHLEYLLKQKSIKNNYINFQKNTGMEEFIRFHNFYEK